MDAVCAVAVGIGDAEEGVAEEEHAAVDVLRAAAVEEHWKVLLLWVGAPAGSEVELGSAEGEGPMGSERLLRRKVSSASSAVGLATTRKSTIVREGAIVNMRKGMNHDRGPCRKSIDGGEGGRRVAWRPTAAIKEVQRRPRPQSTCTAAARTIPALSSLAPIEISIMFHQYQGENRDSHLSHI